MRIRTIVAGITVLGCAAVYADGAPAGDRLLLTHYCMAGNQPRMALRSFDASTGALAFDFIDATNLATPAAGHMHSVAIRIADANHIATEWQFHENGQTKMTETAKYTRVR